MKAIKNHIKTHLNPKTKKQKILSFLYTLVFYVFAAVYFLWLQGKLDVLPKLAFVTSFALIPVVISLVAVGFASKDKSASPRAFKHN